MFRKSSLISAMILGVLGSGIRPVFSQDSPKKIYRIRWKEVTGRTLSENLSLRNALLDFESQKITYRKSFASFLPRISYQGRFVQNLELPVFVFQGQTNRVGTDYNIQHTLQLNLPVFTGGLITANVLTLIVIPIFYILLNVQRVRSKII